MASPRALGVLLLRCRGAAGWKLRRASTEAGISYSYLSKLEAGSANGIPSLKVLSRLGRVYGRPVVELLEAAGVLDPTLPACFDGPAMFALGRVVTLLQQGVQHAPDTPEGRHWKSEAQRVAAQIEYAGLLKKEMSDG